jgi:4-diphosphocytidyl-2-C-methyl-D-erythritol kinase
MICRRSYTRITLALDIIGRLEQGPYRGYHELGIIKHQIDLFDTLHIEEASDISIECSDSRVPRDRSNICWRAAELVMQRFGIDCGVKITIEKRIPVMGGLAGGSANAATVVLMLNEQWDLGMELGELRQIGRRLGMDVPYYFTGGTVFDTETQGWPERISSDLQFDFVLFVPPFGISTAAAYRGIDYSRVGWSVGQTSRMRQALTGNDKDVVIESMHNDFELSVFRAQPALEDYAGKLQRAGCHKVILSGSGSTLAGVARDSDHAHYIARRIGEGAMQVATLPHKPAAHSRGV